MTEKTVDMLFDITQTAAYLGVHVQTLASWRCYCDGPAYIKRGRRVFYKLSALQAFEEKRKAKNECAVEQNRSAPSKNVNS